MRYKKLLTAVLAAGLTFSVMLPSWAAENAEDTRTQQTETQQTRTQEPDTQKTDTQKTDTQKADTQKTDTEKTDTQKADTQKTDTEKTQTQKTAIASVDTSMDQSGELSYDFACRVGLTDKENYLAIVQINNWIDGEEIISREVKVFTEGSCTIKSHIEGKSPADVPEASAALVGLYRLMTQEEAGTQLTLNTSVHRDTSAEYVAINSEVEGEIKDPLYLAYSYFMDGETLYGASLISDTSREITIEQYGYGEDAGMEILGVYILDKDTAGEFPMTSVASSTGSAVKPATGSALGMVPVSEAKISVKSSDWEKMQGSSFFYEKKDEIRLPDKAVGLVLLKEKDSRDNESYEALPATGKDVLYMTHVAQGDDIDKLPVYTYELYGFAVPDVDIIREVSRQTGENFAQIYENWADQFYSGDENAVYTDEVTISRLQQALNEHGFDCGSADGKAGQKTYAAMDACQKANGLEVTRNIKEDLLRFLGVIPGEPQQAFTEPQS